MKQTKVESQEEIEKKQKVKPGKLKKEIREALTGLGYNELTKIQTMAIPALLEGKDVVGMSQTGSGKTAAFSIPICEKVDWEERAPQALILEPTRELATQVREEIFSIGRRRRLKVPVVLGGMPISQQINDLRQRAHIVVGTPGRILDHVRRGTIPLQKIKYVVIDEADLMLDMGFIEDVNLILKELSTKPVMALFSATMGEHLEQLVSDYMESPLRITVPYETLTVDTINQEYYEVATRNKFALLMDLFTIENPESAIIFCATRDMVNVLFRQMKQERLLCGMLHGGLDQRERMDTIEAFRNGKFRHLITTDVSARGVDFDGISHVFNYDFPTKRENYVHRIGRTGRNGASGKAISFIETGYRSSIEAMERFTGSTIREKMPPTVKEVEDQKASFYEKQRTPSVHREKKGASLQKDIVKIAISGGKRSKMRAGDIVGTLCSLDYIVAEDIGIIDIRDTMTYVEVLHGKGRAVIADLQKKTIKGKLRSIKQVRI